MASVATSSVLLSTWDRYLTWTNTANKLKDQLDLWRFRTLTLTIAGAALATLGQQLGIPHGRFGGWPVFGTVVSVLGASAIGLAAYFVREAMGDDKAQQWVKARAAAECLKASIFLFRSNVPPFEMNDKESKLADRMLSIENSISDLETLPVMRDTLLLDLAPLTITDYIVKRVDDQINWYRAKATTFQTKSKQLRQLVFWLGALSVLLGGIAAKLPGIAVYTAVIATVTAALSSHSHAQRYQNLITSYQGTALRLQTIKAEWDASHKTEADTNERNAFIQCCENTMALENGSWVALWSQKPRA